MLGVFYQCTLHCIYEANCVSMYLVDYSFAFCMERKNVGGLLIVTSW